MCEIYGTWDFTIFDQIRINGLDFENSQHPNYSSQGLQIAQETSSTNFLKGWLGLRDGLMIRKKLTNLPLEEYPSSEGNPISHYWPKNSEQDALQGDFLGD